MKEATIRVAVGRVRLDIPACGSLKSKRRVIRPLVKRLRDRFGISAAEVGLNDVWQSAVLAVAAVGSDASQLDGLMHDVVSFIRRNAEAVLVDFRVEVIPLGELLPAADPATRTVSGLDDIERQWLSSSGSKSVGGDVDTCCGGEIAVIDDRHDDCFDCDGDGDGDSDGDSGESEDLQKQREERS